MEGGRMTDRNLREQISEEFHQELLMAHREAWALLSLPRKRQIYAALSEEQRNMIIEDMTRPQWVRDFEARG